MSASTRCRRPRRRGASRIAHNAGPPSFGQGAPEPEHARPLCPLPASGVVGPPLCRARIPMRARPLCPLPASGVVGPPLCRARIPMRARPLCPLPASGGTPADRLPFNRRAGACLLPLSPISLPVCRPGSPRAAGQWLRMPSQPGGIPSQRRRSLLDEAGEFWEPTGDAVTSETDQEARGCTNQVARALA